LDPQKHYVIKVVACTLTQSCTESDELKYTVPKKDISKAVTAGLVGGMLFFIIAIILSVCAVKICNRRKRRKQEKGKRTQQIYDRIFCLSFSFLFPATPACGTRMIRWDS
jgi:hypothetical protein